MTKEKYMLFVADVKAKNMSRQALPPIRVINWNVVGRKIINWVCTHYKSVPHKY